jgi:putative transposase
MATVAVDLPRHRRGRPPQLYGDVRDIASCDGLELELVQEECNGVRLHSRHRLRTPHDEHEERGEQIRKARRDGLGTARQQRIAYRREHPIPRT